MSEPEDWALAPVPESAPDAAPWDPDAAQPAPDASSATAARPDPPGPAAVLGRQSYLLAWAAVLGTVIWSLWELRATLLPVPYLDDASVHEQMVRFATARLRGGHNPLTSWFPYLQQGSPHFLHYQSLPAMITGLIGIAVGPDTAFRWSLYLLWCLWPIAIYASARLMRLGRFEAAVAAMVSPLLSSVAGVGYEQKGYIWIGYGVWTQLFASWTLPFAWATTWRAMENKRFIAPATLLIGLTAAFHFETGYLAIIPVALFPFVVRADLKARLARAVTLLVASCLAIAWVVVPLLAESNWAAINQPLLHGPLENGYGARQVLVWLVGGKGFDNARFPSVSFLVGIGVMAGIFTWRKRKEARLLLLLFALGLVLSFGRTTWGPLVDIIPGSHDVFFRRFFMATQLAGIYLAGVGAVALARAGIQALTKAARPLRVATQPPAGQVPSRALTLVPVGLAAVLGFALLLPAWLYANSYDNLNAVNIAYQRGADTSSEIGPILSYISTNGGGRAYAGSPSDYGVYFNVGSTSVFKYLEDVDADEVGYTLRTAALMDGAEFYFDDNNPGDYALFGIRYLVLPDTKKPPRGATFVMKRGIYRLFVLKQNGYFRVVDTIGSVSENRGNVGSQSRTYLDSSLPSEHAYFTVAFPGAPAAAPTSPGLHPPAGVPGRVLSQQPDLPDGAASATVDLSRRAVVVLSASYDPGWQVTVDGHPAPTEMLEPALVGVAVPAGQHTVTFHYVGFSWYPELVLLALLDLAAVAVLTLRRRQD